MSRKRFFGGLRKIQKVSARLERFQTKWTPGMGTAIFGVRRSRRAPNRTTIGPLRTFMPFDKCSIKNRSGGGGCAGLRVAQDRTGTWPSAAR